MPPEDGAAFGLFPGGVREPRSMDEVLAQIDLLKGRQTRRLGQSPQEIWREARGAPGSGLSLPDVAAAAIGETPGEFAFNLAMTPFKVPQLFGKAVMAARAAAPLTFAADEAEGIIPASRQGAQTARRAVINVLKGSKGESRTGIDPLEAERAAKRAQRSIDIGRRLDEPGPQLDLTGYNLFDYANMGPDLGAPQFSALRPRPAQNRFERLPQETQFMVTDPYVYQMMRKAMERGAPFKNWYDIRQYRDALLNEGMSPHEFDVYMQMQQAAAHRNGPEQQMRMGNFLWGQHKSGLLTPNTNVIFPEGYGSLAQKQIAENAKRISGGTPIDSEKLFSYGQNYGGNWWPSTVDTHAYRGPAILSHDARQLEQQIRSNATPAKVEALREQGAANLRLKGDQVVWSPRETHYAGNLPLREAIERPGLWRASPEGSNYGAVEQYLYNPLSSELGMLPAQGQAAEWVGLGPITGLRSENKLMLQMFEDELRRIMAMNPGMTPQQAIRAVATGNTRVLGAPIPPR